MLGRIHNIVADRGFGFLEPNGGGPRVFFHVRQLDPATPFDDSLVGRRCEYQAAEGERGLRATDLKFID